MDPHNNIGAPFDPEPEDQLPDNQRPLNEDYLEDAARDVPENLLDNPEDIPSEEVDQLREAVRDDMPGDTEDAIRRQIESPNERDVREDDPGQYNSDHNPRPEDAIGEQSVADAAAEREMKGDMSDDDPDAVQRIG